MSFLFFEKILKPLFHFLRLINVKHNLKLQCDTKEEVKREDRADILSLSPQTELENI